MSIFLKYEDDLNDQIGFLKCFLDLMAQMKEEYLLDDTVKVAAFYLVRKVEEIQAVLNELFKKIYDNS